MACRMRRTVVCVEQVTGAAAARGPGFCGWRGRQAKGSGAVRDCRRAYLDLERAGGRLALIGRLAALLARTPAGLRPIGLLLVPGPERAAVRRGGSGLAGMLSVRVVATATGAGQPGQMLAADPAGRRAWRPRSWWAWCTGSPSPRAGFGGSQAGPAGLLLSVRAEQMIGARSSASATPSPGSRS